MSLPKFLLKEAIVAPEGFNRWRVPPASIAIHLCIGSVYAWSNFSPALIRELGVAGSAADDWSLTSVTWIFSVAIVFLGLAAAIAGKWLERVGPRCVGVTAAFLWGGGFLIGSLGVATHQIWLLYLGYGVLGGCGLGLGYVSPVSTLIKWFPDRRGMAAGMAIMGFGGGAIIAAPMEKWLLSVFAKAPESLGDVSTIKMITEGGRRFADAGDGLREVVVSGQEAFAVGTGNTGVAMTFLTLGIAYFVVMNIASFSYRVPAEGWSPAGWRPPTEQTASKKMISRNHVHIDQALKTPQFYLLWIVLCFNVTAGIGVLGVAKTMMNEIFGPTITQARGGAGTNSLTTVVIWFAINYVAMIGVFNMLGRFVWASASDYLGRKNTFHCFFVLGTLLYSSIPFMAQAVSREPSVFWLTTFCVVTMVIFTMYGGGFATIPAYLADIFGSRFVGGIHGRLLTAWSTAGVLGPLAITTLRAWSSDTAIQDLARSIDTEKFEKTFGAPLLQLPELMQAKTVTIASLMKIAPPGTIDPTPGLYDTTMYMMAGLLVLAFFANSAIRPVDDRHHLRE
jgi:MFS family permease